jgi:hypothetical protein
MKKQRPFPASYHVKTSCYLADDGQWIPDKTKAKTFDFTELPYINLDRCTLEKVGTLDEASSDLHQGE